MSRQQKQNAAEPPSLQQAVDKMQESFVYFDLGLGKEERAALDKIHVSCFKNCDCFGDAAQLEPEVRKFFESLGNEADVSTTAAQAVDRLAQEALAAFKAEAVWIAVRASLPTNGNGMPRWHHDGYFYKPFEGDRYKVAMPLKGAGTLFSRFPKGLRPMFSELARKGNDWAGLAELVGKTPVESIPEGQGAVFVGGSSRAAIHSEPPVQAERLFMSVVPGTKAQISQMQDKYLVRSALA